MGQWVKGLFTICSYTHICRKKKWNSLCILNSDMKHSDCCFSLKSPHPFSTERGKRIVCVCAVFNTYEYSLPFTKSMVKWYLGIFREGRLALASVLIQQKIMNLKGLGHEILSNIFRSTKEPQLVFWLFGWFFDGLLRLLFPDNILK